MTHTITLLPGDGIGPEVTAAVVQVLEAAGLQATWEPFEAGANAVAAHGTTLPEPLLASIRKTRCALKGPITTPIGEGFTSVNVGLRKALELYANLRPVWNLPNVKSRYEGVDLVIVRENTEDLYAGLEHTVVPGVVESLKIITEVASTRIARFAFEHARREKRKRVTAVHKANIMKLSDGLFIECARRVAKDFPEIQYDERIVDAACMQLVVFPEKFDVLLLPNLYGDIVSDLCAGLVGGLGVVPAANLGAEGVGVFEAVHGSAPDIAGKNIANPLAAILSMGIMLRYSFDRPDLADRVHRAVSGVLSEGFRTADIFQPGTRKVGTREMGDAVVAALHRA